MQKQTNYEELETLKQQIEDQKEKNRKYEEQRSDIRTQLKDLKEKYMVLQARETDLSARLIRRNQE